MNKEEIVMMNWVRTLGLVLEPAISFNDVRVRLDSLERQMIELDREGWSNARNFTLVMRAALAGAKLPSS